MLYRSLGARSFDRFWWYWNPIFGYYLGKHVHAPLKRWVWPGLAIIATFIICGALHDLVTIAARGSLSLLFVPWFILLGLGVVISKAINMDISSLPWIVRAGINVSYILVSLSLAFYVVRLLALK